MTKGGGTGRRGSKDRKRVSPTTRRDVFTETGRRCAFGGCSRDAVALHHIDGNPSDDSPGNLLALCRVHHVLAHLDTSAFWQQLWRRVKGVLVDCPQYLAANRPALRRTWKALCTTRGARQAREDCFELLVEGLVASIPCLTIADRRRAAAGSDLDLVLRNERSHPLFRRLPQQMVVACDVQRARPLDDEYVRAFLDRLVAGRWAAGLLIGIGGSTDGAGEAARHVNSTGLFITLLGSREVSVLIDAEDRAQAIRDLVRRSRRH